VTSEKQSILSSENDFNVSPIFCNDIIFASVSPDRVMLTGFPNTCTSHRVKYDLRLLDIVIELPIALHVNVFTVKKPPFFTS
jgi:hypothetical protein